MTNTSLKHASPLAATRTAWVTGAGKGIGRALALTLARRGWTVAASARSQDDLAKLADEATPLAGRIVTFPLDITDEAAVLETVARIEAELAPLDVAVLNAGTHRPISADRFDTTAFRTLVDTNLMGTVHCLGALVPRLIARGAGRIAVVASVAGYRGLPSAAGYGATKAALINMCEALRPDLARHGVALQVISPGFVDTPLTRKNDFPMPFLIAPEEAAEAMARGLERDSFEVVFPWRMAVTMKLLRLLPYWLFFRITRRMLD